MWKEKKIVINHTFRFSFILWHHQPSSLSLSLSFLFLIFFLDLSIINFIVKIIFVHFSFFSLIPFHFFVRLFLLNHKLFYGFWREFMHAIKCTFQHSFILSIFTHLFFFVTFFFFAKPEHFCGFFNTTLLFAFFELFFKHFFLFLYSFFLCNL